MNSITHTPHIDEKTYKNYVDSDDFADSYSMVKNLIEQIQVEFNSPLCAELAASFELLLNQSKARVSRQKAIYRSILIEFAKLPNIFKDDTVDGVLSSLHQDLRRGDIDDIRFTTSIFSIIKHVFARVSFKSRTMQSGHHIEGDIFFDGSVDVASVARDLSVELTTLSDQMTSLYPGNNEIAILRNEMLEPSFDSGWFLKSIDLLKRFSWAAVNLHNDKIDSDKVSIDTLSTDFNRLQDSCAEIGFVTTKGHKSVEGFNALLTNEISSLLDFQRSNDVETLGSKINSIQNRLSHFIAEQAGIIENQKKLIGFQKSDLLKINSHVKELRRQLEETHDIVCTDQLTGLNNRRGYEQHLSNKFAEWESDSNLVSLILIDCDHFKMVNDTHGHAIGDGVLRHVSKILDNIKSLFPTSHVSRYGGEEFAIIIDGVPQSKVVAAAKIIRMAVEKNPFVSDDSSIKINVTVSLGVSFLSEVNDSVDKLFSSADRCLYKAKRNGRNQIFVCKLNKDEANL